jgi:hypothetical protein
MYVLSLLRDAKVRYVQIARSGSRKASAPAAVFA